MNSHLPDFYRLVDLEPKADMLALRETAIQSMIESSAAPDWLGIVRIFLNRSVSPETRSVFAGVFRTVDAIFPLRGNDAEMVVLAGASLYELLQQESGTADVAAYALVCADAMGNGVRGPIPDLLDRARTYLRDAAVAAREEVNQDKVPRIRAGTNPAKDLKALPVTAVPSDWTIVDTQLQETRTRTNELLTAIKGMHGGLAKTIEQIAELATRTATQPHAAAIQALREETDVLWWLFGERSRDLDEGFDQLPPEAVALVTAKELADLTRVLPGPPAARALLSRALRIAGRSAEEGISLREVVAAAPREWRGTWVASRNVALDDLTPVHGAVRRSLEVDDGADWTAAYDRGSVLLAGTEFARLDLAEQVFFEGMLHRAVLAEEAAQ
jgi:hypothetical protein